MKRALTILVAIMWIGVLLGGSFRPAAPGLRAGALARQGYTAPAVELVDRNGNPVTLADYKGKALFLNFWASWCPPCRMEMPEIERLAANLPEGTAVLTVNATATESGGPSAAMGFLKANGYTFPVALDLNGRTAAAYQVISFPTSLFIGPDGTVAARINGPLTESAMAGYLKAARR